LTISGSSDRDYGSRLVVGFHTHEDIVNDRVNRVRTPSVKHSNHLPPLQFQLPRHHIHISDITNPPIPSTDHLHTRIEMVEIHTARIPLLYLLHEASRRISPSHEKPTTPYHEPPSTAQSSDSTCLHLLDPRYFRQDARRLVRSRRQPQRRGAQPLDQASQRLGGRAWWPAPKMPTMPGLPAE
jgi:hypothetical protein